MESMPVSAGPRMPTGPYSYEDYLTLATDSRIVEWMLADAPSLPEELRAVYRRMLEVL